MFESLYSNIGGKIKNWAMWIFVVEAIGAVAGALVLLFQGDEFIITGLLTIVLGPIIAWVSSWLLYAFGELVEKTCMNEKNTRVIAEMILKSDDKTPKPFSAPISTKSESEKAQPAQHKWRCHYCGSMRGETPCERCGKE